MTIEPNSPRSSSLDMEIEVWLEGTCDEDNPVVAVDLNTAGSQSSHHFRFTIAEATGLRDGLIAAIVEHELSLEDDDPFINALYDSDTIYTARNLAESTNKPVYVHQYPDGKYCVSHEVPHCNLYVRVDPNWVLTLTDER